MKIINLIRRTFKFWPIKDSTKKDYTKSVSLYNKK